MRIMKGTLRTVLIVEPFVIKIAHPKIKRALSTTWKFKGKEWRRHLPDILHNLLIEPFLENIREFVYYQFSRHRSFNKTYFTKGIITIAKYVEGVDVVKFDDDSVCNKIDCPDEILKILDGRILHTLNSKNIAIDGNRKPIFVDFGAEGIDKFMKSYGPAIEEAIFKAYYKAL